MAIFVCVIGLLGIYSLVPRIISTIAVNFDRFVAVQLAREGLEIVRNIRDTNMIARTGPWRDDLDNCLDTIGGCEVDYQTPTVPDPVPLVYSGNYLRINNEGFFNYTSGDPTKFQRRVSIVPAPDDSYIEVTVEVYWRDPAEDEINTLVLEEWLYDWR